MPPNITTLPLWSLLCNVGGKDRNSFFPSFPHSAGHTRYVFQELPFFLFCRGILASVLSGFTWGSGAGRSE